MRPKLVYKIKKRIINQLNFLLCVSLFLCNPSLYLSLSDLYMTFSAFLIGELVTKTELFDPAGLAAATSTGKMQVNFNSSYTIHLLSNGFYVKMCETVSHILAKDHPIFVIQLLHSTSSQGSGW